jgi:hypothetical protein
MYLVSKIFNNLRIERLVPNKSQDGFERTTPAMTPPEPIPAMALPMINAIELGAAPHIAEPTSKSTNDVKKTYLTRKQVYILPKTSWNAQLVIM